MAYKKKDADLPDFAQVERQEMLRGTGLGEEGIRRPQIGVVSSWGEVNPGSVHLDKIAKSVKDGIWAAGGTPREFVISSICTSMAGHDNYHLPHRDLVAGYIETVAMTNLFDAMVFVPVCDDVVPGHLMALARIDLPSIVVTGGYMSVNRHLGKPIDPLKVANKHFNDFKEGRTSKREFNQIVDRGCKGTGACPVMGTANTMATLTEALGLSLPGTAATPGADSRLQRIAFAAGQRVVDLLKDDIRPSQILTEDAFRNRTTPFICGISPNGPGMMQDLDEAGGIPAVMKELESILDTQVMTVTGQALSKTLKEAPNGEGRIIKSIADPIANEGGLVFLEGSLAPEGALVKQSAVPATMHQFKGPARLFTTEDDASEALMANEIQSGTVVIVRGMGPAGAPGMQLLQRFLWLSAAKGMQDKIAFLTDGRFSGTNKGCAVAHISPESAVGGPLALVEDGDLVEIDIPHTRLDLLVDEDELARRRAVWTRPEPRTNKGYLSVYSKMADKTARGASLKYK